MPAESLTAWAKPLRSVTEVAVGSTRSKDDRVNNRTWRWSTTYTVSIGDKSLALPLQGLTSTDSSERTDRFVLELLERI